jgi:hypothetical protein
MMHCSLHYHVQMTLVELAMKIFVVLVWGIGGVGYGCDKPSCMFTSSNQLWFGSRSILFGRKIGNKGFFVFNFNL